MINLELLKRKLFGVRMEDWIDVPAILSTKKIVVEGTILYGVRDPIKPGNAPLINVSVGPKKKVRGIVPGYYFLNYNLDAGIGDEIIKGDVKVRLLTHWATSSEVRGIGYYSQIFRYQIRKS